MKKTVLIIALCCAIIPACPGYATDGVIQCANLIYGGNHTSRCFSDEFLSAVQKTTAIATERRFKSVKLGSEELFQYPFVMMTGESHFHFTSAERANLRKYLLNGGFLLASSGCSSKNWDRSFRREMEAVLGENLLEKISMDHPIFRTVHKIDKLELEHPADEPSLEGIELDGKIVVIYSPHGLNDTNNAQDCCCCGGNEIKNALEVNVNILVYALLH